MKTLIPFLVLCLGGVVSAQADEVTLVMEKDTAGNGTTHVNVTSAFTETTPLEGTAEGASWGGAGLNIGGSPVTFTNGPITDYLGAVSADPITSVFYNDNNGMGINHLVDEGVGVERRFLVDEQEAFSWTASKELAFEGMVVRSWGEGENRQVTISSSDWIGLAGVVPDTGITYTSGTGSFTITEEVGNPIAPLDTLTAEMLVGGSGPALNFFAGGISFANGPGNGFAPENITFSAEAVSVVLGDANDDGSVNSFDIAAFGMALFEPAAYALAYPGVDVNEQLDMNGDDTFNSFDIPGFGTALGF